MSPARGGLGGGLGVGLEGGLGVGLDGGLPRRGGGRQGVAAVELLVALVLVGLVVVGLWRVFADHRRATAELRLRTEVLDADRAVRGILGAELAAGLPGRDWTVTSPGVLDLRAFRGWAMVCRSVGLVDALVVAYRGLRFADPEKDSVLVLRGDGRWASAALTSRAYHDEQCPGTAGLPVVGATLERWTLDPAVPDPVLLRVYERGSYHLADGSLRYRRGAGGRQPLTPAVLDPVRSGIELGGDSTEVVLSVHGVDGRGGGWTRILFGNGGWER